MIIDGLLLFSGTSNGSTGGTGSGSYTDLPTSSTTYSANVIDLGISGLPVTSGSSGTGTGGGARDIGVGDDPSMKIVVDVTVAFDTLTSMHCILQGTHDNGSGAPYSSDWTTMATGPEVTLANLVAGARIFDQDMPRPVPGQVLPRYLRIGYVVTGSANTGGLVLSALVIDRNDQIIGAAATISGYQAGITVAN